MPKGKGRARTTAKPTNFQDAYERAIYEEEQAERYQWGDKARRLYEQALELYRLAFSFDVTQSDPMYNE